jgi:glycerate kinase
MNVILVAPNSFKDCIDSNNAAEVISKSILKGNYKIKNQFKVLKRPISDGGNGFLTVCKKYLNLNNYNFNINFLDNGTNNVPVGYDYKNRTAYVEVAKVLGLESVSDTNNNGLNPYKYNSYPLGQLLALIEKHNKQFNVIDKLIIGIGGTITSDLGLGMMQEFNLKLKKSIEYITINPMNYIFADCIEYTKPNLSFNIEIVTDVNNPLLGENGANYVFGLQKGIKKEDLQLFEKGFENVINLLNIDKIDDYSGAGGGVAFALQFFFNAKRITGEDFILNTLKLNDITPDYVITGEGSFDEQSLLNKGTKVVIDLGLSKKAKKIFVISGKRSNIKNNNLTIYNIQDYFESIEESKQKVKIGLKNICEIITQEIIKDRNGE